VAERILEQAQSFRFQARLLDVPGTGARRTRRSRPARERLDVVAEATYSSPDPSCTKSIEYRPAGNRIVQVFVQLQPPRGALRRVSAGVGRIPLGEPHPGQDGAIDPYGRPKCGKPDFGDWYQDAVAYAPARLLAKPRVTITTHHEEKFSDPGIESLEWTLKVVLQRVGYRKINCATHPGC